MAAVSDIVATIDTLFDILEEMDEQPGEVWEQEWLELEHRVLGVFQRAADRRTARRKAGL